MIFQGITSGDPKGGGFIFFLIVPRRCALWFSFSSAISLVASATDSPASENEKSQLRWDLHDSKKSGGERGL
jgi:hypothetical protein